MKYGKLRLFHIMNLIVILGSLLSLIDNMYVICLGRFLFGVAAGGFTVYSPNYINESVPTELKGPLGAMCQFGFCFGIFLPAILGLAIPDDPFETEALNSFYVT
jgi:MFS transporter, SP family, sugar:H+ symporter